MLRASHRADRTGRTGHSGGETGLEMEGSIGKLLPSMYVCRSLARSRTFGESTRTREEFGLLQNRAIRLCRVNMEVEQGRVMGRKKGKIHERRKTCETL